MKNLYKEKEMEGQAMENKLTGIDSEDCKENFMSRYFKTEAEKMAAKVEGGADQRKESGMERPLRPIPSLIF